MFRVGSDSEPALITLQARLDCRWTGNYLVTAGARTRYGWSSAAHLAWLSHRVSWCRSSTESSSYRNPASTLYRLGETCGRVPCWQFPATALSTRIPRWRAWRRPIAASAIPRRRPCGSEDHPETQGSRVTATGSSEKLRVR